MVKWLTIVGLLLCIAGFGIKGFEGISSWQAKKKRKETKVPTVSTPWYKKVLAQNPKGPKIFTLKKGEEVSTGWSCPADGVSSSQWGPSKACAYLDVLEGRLEDLEIYGMLPEGRPWSPSDSVSGIREGETFYIYAGYNEEFARPIRLKAKSDIRVWIGPPGTIP